MEKIIPYPSPQQSSVYFKLLSRVCTDMEKITHYPSTEKSLQGVHPIDKLVVRGGRTWCMDLLDVFVRAGQSVSRWPQIQEFVDVGVLSILLLQLLFLSYLVHGLA